MMNYWWNGWCWCWSGWSTFEFIKSGNESSRLCLWFLSGCWINFKIFLLLLLLLTNYAVFHTCCDIINSPSLFAYHDEWLVIVYNSLIFFFLSFVPFYSSKKLIKRKTTNADASRDTSTQFFSTSLKITHNCWKSRLLNEIMSGRPNAEKINFKNRAILFNFTLSSFIFFCHQIF